MGMKLQETFEIPGDPERVWALLRDPEFVARCMPGVELVGRGEDGSYLGRISVGFGPTTASFSGRADFSIADDTRTGHIEARGTDKRGSTRASASVDVAVEPLGDSARVRVDGSIDVLGPLSSFASTGGVHVTRVLLSEFAACVAATVAGASAGDALPPSSSRLSAVGVLTRSLGSGLRSAWRRIRRR